MKTARRFPSAGLPTGEVPKQKQCKVCLLYKDWGEFPRRRRTCSPCLAKIALQVVKLRHSGTERLRKAAALISR